MNFCVDFLFMKEFFFCITFVPTYRKLIIKAINLIFSVFSFKLSS